MIGGGEDGMGGGEDKDDVRMEEEEGRIGVLLKTGPRHNHMVQAEAMTTRVIRQLLSFLAWILF